MNSDKRIPLPWDLDLGNESYRPRLIFDLLDWITRANAIENSQADSYAEIDTDSLDELLSDSDLTFVGFVQTLESRGFLFRPDHLAQFIRDFYRERGLVVPPAIRYAAERMDDDLQRATHDLLQQLDQYERYAGNDASRNTALNQELLDRTQEVESANDEARRVQEESAAQLEQYSQRIDQSTTDPKDLQKQLDECRAHRETVQTPNAAEVTEQQGKIEELQKENQRITKELEDALKTLQENLGSDSGSTNGDVEEQLAHCREQGKKLADENTELQGQLEELNIKAQGLEKANTEKAANLKAFEVEWEDRRVDNQRGLEDKDRRIRGLEQQIEAAELAKSTTEAAELAKSTAKASEDPFFDGTSQLQEPKPELLQGMGLHIPHPLDSIPQIQEPPRRSPSPPSPAIPSPLPAKLHALQNPSARLAKPLQTTIPPHTPLRTPTCPKPGTPKTPSSPGGFNLLLGYRPNGWQARDTRWRQSEIGQQVLARTRDRAIERNAEENEMEELRRQAYAALTGSGTFPKVARELRKANYRRIAVTKYALPVVAVEC